MSELSPFKAVGTPVRVSMKTVVGQFEVHPEFGVHALPLVAGRCGATHGAGCKDDNNRGSCDKEAGHSGADHEHHCGTCGRIF